MKLLVGTSNPGKWLEIAACLRDLRINLLSRSHFASWPRIEEDGHTYEENALKKARSLAQFSSMLTLADDSGLEVAALGGAPGIRSARYAGHEGNYEKNNRKLFHELADVPWERRRARFVCVLALCMPSWPQKKEWVFRADCEGVIDFLPKGKRGFGYDPLFFYPPLDKTFGELSPQKKTQVSHRGKALEKLREALAAIIHAR